MIVDCTASAAIARHYPEWLAAGIHVVTPNKQAGSADLAFYRTLGRGAARRRLALPLRGDGRRRACRSSRRCAICARPAIASGRIEGILSGTLSYLFNVWDGEQPFSALVRDAKAQGYTEPDPRDDLSGTDVARKLIILAREMGLDLELADVELEGLVPESLRSATADEFLARVPEVDAAMRERFDAARARGQRAALRRAARRRHAARPPSAWSSSSRRISSPTSA